MTALLLEVELAIEKLKSHLSPGTGKIPVELIKAGSRRTHYEIYNLLFLFRKRGIA